MSLTSVTATVVFLVICALGLTYGLDLRQYLGTALTMSVVAAIAALVADALLEVQRRADQSYRLRHPVANLLRGN